MTKIKLGVASDGNEDRLKLREQVPGIELRRIATYTVGRRWLVGAERDSE
jgi:hypothetical protein